jgi:alpha-glucosidase
VSSSLSLRTDPATAIEGWWRGAVIYQIYPRSFRDSNGDGIGDLKGIVDGLDHVAGLGVDAVWISPFYTSPMRDYGYDIADYCDVDPSFGTLEDFDRVIEKAHALGLKVIIDQVYSHTSSDHPWFQESRQDHRNGRADWYVWADPKPDGSPPNNWQSVFGGPAWQWDGPRKQYYLHNFLTSQPDLNVHNPDVQNALLDVARFWLDRGVDGFRLDAINFAMHDPRFRDNPPNGAPMSKVTRPFDMQTHLYNQSHPDIVGFLERLRQLIDTYQGRFTVAEVGGPDPLAEMKAFTEGNSRLNSAYNFDFLYAERLTADLVRKSVGHWTNDPDEGWPSWAFSNHDAPRAVTRWQGPFDREQVARCNMLLLLALRGNVFIYQGEELALPQGQVAFEHLKDPEAIANWPHTLGRDGARTPFPWQDQAETAGFTTGVAWLPIDPVHRELSATSPSAAAMIAFTRSLVELRNSLPSLRTGALSFLEAPADVVAIAREHEGERTICVFNLGDAEIEWAPDGLSDLTLLADHNGPATNEVPVPSLLAPRTGYWALSSNGRSQDGR